MRGRFIKNENLTLIHFRKREKIAWAWQAQFQYIFKYGTISLFPYGREGKGREGKGILVLASTFAMGSDTCPMGFFAGCY